MKITKELIGKREEDLAFAAVSNIVGVKAYRNVYIPRHGGLTAEIDILLLSRKGIFAIEVKGFGGIITGSTVRFEWTRTFKNKKTKTKQKLKFYNPLRQHNAHIKALSRYLKISQTDCHGMIVFSDKAILKKIPPSTRSYSIIQTKYLRSALVRRLKLRDDRFSPAEMKRMIQAIESLPAPDNSKKEKHIAQAKQAEKLRIAAQEKRRKYR